MKRKKWAKWQQLSLYNEEQEIKSSLFNSSIEIQKLNPDINPNPFENLPPKALKKMEPQDAGISQEAGIVKQILDFIDVSKWEEVTIPKKIIRNN